MPWTRSSFSCKWVRRRLCQRGVQLSRLLQILMALFLECFPLDHIAELKQDCFCRGLPKQFKPMVAYCKGSSNEKRYSDYLQVAWEVEKEEMMEPSCKPACSQHQQALGNELFSSMEAQRQPTRHDPFCTGSTSEERECWQGGMHQQ